MPLVPTEHLLHKSTPQGLEVTADLSPICKQTKRGYQSGETKKPAPNETTGEISRKELNKTEASNLSDIEFKVMVIRILKVLSENYKKLHGIYREPSGNYTSMKKDIETMNKKQEEMKNIVSEIKNTLEGIKIGLDEAED